MQLTNLNRVYTAIQAECCHSLLQIQSEPEQGKSPSANIIIECVPGSGIVLNHFFFGRATRQVESQFLDQGSNPHPLHWKHWSSRCGLSFPRCCCLLTTSSMGFCVGAPQAPSPCELQGCWSVGPAYPAPSHPPVGPILHPPLPC